MATITSANMEFVLDEVVSSVMFESFFDEPFMYPMLFDVRTSNRRRERSASIGGLGEYQEKGRTQAAAQRAWAFSDVVISTQLRINLTLQTVPTTAITSLSWTSGNQLAL